MLVAEVEGVRFVVQEAAKGLCVLGLLHLQVLYDHVHRELLAALILGVLDYGWFFALYWELYHCALLDFLDWLNCLDCFNMFCSLNWLNCLNNFFLLQFFYRLFHSRNLFLPNHFPHKRLIVASLRRDWSLIPSRIQNKPAQYIDILLFLHHALCIRIDQQYLLPDFLLKDAQLTSLSSCLRLLCTHRSLWVIPLPGFQPFADLLLAVEHWIFFLCNCLATVDHFLGFTV